MRNPSQARWYLLRKVVSAEALQLSDFVMPWVNWLTGRFTPIGVKMRVSYEN